MFMETTQFQAQALAESQEQFSKARTPETYSGKTHIDCYNFCQQFENHFEILGAIGMNRTLFATLYLHNSFSLK